ncbi:hypothetical protein ACPXCX_28090 [Streptomyces sp. DT225]
MVGGVPGGEAGDGEHDSVVGFDAVAGTAATERDGGPVLLGRPAGSVGDGTGGEPSISAALGSGIMLIRLSGAWATPATKPPSPVP